MHDTNRCGLDRHSENVSSTAAIERPPATFDLAGSARKFLHVVRTALL